MVALFTEKKLPKILYKNTNEVTGPIGSEMLNQQLAEMIDFACVSLPSIAHK